MPKLIFRLPKYSLHKTSGHAKVRFNDRTVYLGKYGTPESKEAYAQFIASIPKPKEELTTFAELAPGNVPLIGEVVPRYLAFARTYYCRDGVQTGEATTIRCALQPLIDRFDALPINEFKPDKLEQVQEDMIKAGRARSYINKSCNIVRRLFKWCVRKGFVTGETLLALQAVDGLKRGRSKAKETAPIGPVDDQRVEAIIPHVSELVGDVVRVMRLTGMRPGEAVSMTPDQIDRTDPTVWEFTPGHHKTEHHGHARTVFLGPNAIEIVRRYLLKAGDGEKLFPINRDGLRRAIDRGCARAFPHPAVASLSDKSLTDAERAQIKAKIKTELKSEIKAWNNSHRWHPNQMRHSVGTEVRSKFGLEGAQVILGHAKANMTETYAERDMSKARDIARKIG